MAFFDFFQGIKIPVLIMIVIIYLEKSKVIATASILSSPLLGIFLKGIDIAVA